MYDEIYKAYRMACLKHYPSYLDILTLDAFLFHTYQMTVYDTGIVVNGKFLTVHGEES